MKNSDCLIYIERDLQIEGKRGPLWSTVFELAEEAGVVTCDSLNGVVQWLKESPDVVLLFVPMSFLSSKLAQAQLWDRPDHFYHLCCEWGRKKPESDLAGEVIVQGLIW